MSRKIFLIASVLLLSLVVFLIYAGIFGWNIESVAYNPPTKPEFTGALAPNKRLEAAEIFAKNKIIGGEDIAVDKEAGIYTGSVKDGKIYRITPHADKPETIELFADVGSFPVGLKFDKDENLIVCHNPKGLLSVSPMGEISVLTDTADGTKLGFADDLDIASDGKIYFSDATTKFTGNNGNPSWEYELFEAKPYGRLLVYDPQTKETKVLLHDLYFANGVSLSKNEDFVVVLETFRFRAVRYWLKGEKAGTWDYLHENLPGYPDGIMKNENGDFWIAIPTRRNALADWLQPRPFWKNVLTTLPKFLWNSTENYGLVVKLNENGEIIESLHDTTGNIFFVTNAVEKDGFLYLGTLKGDWIARVKLP